MPLEPAAALFLTAMERQCVIRSQCYDLSQHRRQHNHDEHDHNHHHDLHSRRYAADDSHSAGYGGRASHSDEDDDQNPVPPPPPPPTDALGRMQRSDSLQQFEKAFCFDSAELGDENEYGAYGDHYLTQQFEGGIEGRPMSPLSNGTASPPVDEQTGLDEDGGLANHQGRREDGDEDASAVISSAMVLPPADPGPVGLVCQVATDAATVSTNMTVGTLAHCAVIASRTRVLQLLLQAGAQRKAVTSDGLRMEDLCREPPDTDGGGGRDGVNGKGDGGDGGGGEGEGGGPGEGVTRRVMALQRSVDIVVHLEGLAGPDVEGEEAEEGLEGAADEASTAHGMSHEVKKRWEEWCAFHSPPRRMVHSHSPLRTNHSIPASNWPVPSTWSSHCVSQKLARTSQHDFIS